MLEDDSLVNCMCSKCLQADPNGVVVTKDQHLAHKRNARQRAHVDSRLAQLRANGWDDPPLPPDRRMSLDITTEPDVELEGHSMDLDPPLARDENQEIVEELAHILKELKNSCPQKSQFNILPFVFSQTPHLYGLPGNPTEQDIDRICSLDVNTPSNADYLRYFDLLDKGAKYARMQQEHASATIRMQSLLVVETVDQSRRSLREARLADWKRQADLTKQPYFVDTTRYYQDAIPYIPVSLLLVYLIAASLYLLSNVSQDDCKFLLSALGLLLQILTASSVDIRARNAARGMFHTIGPVLALLDVVPRYASFVCCKQCYYIHWFDPNDHHTKRLERCPNTTKNGICNARFWVGKNFKLNDLKKHLLRQLCVDSGVLSVDGTRGELASRLLQYRIEQRWWTADDKHIVEENIDHVADYERLRDGTTTDDFFWHASKTTVTKAIKPDLLMVFIRHVQPTIVPPKSDEEVNGLKKELLLQYIQDERQRLGIIDENGIHATAIATQAKNQCANILGKGVLKEIRRDMQSINRPSWQPSGPRSPGEARFGKFTAAQWRTFCLINLPITLTRLWGNAHPDSFQRKCLDNFLHLVAAVKIASMNRMNEDRVQDYERHIQLYLSSLLELYPRSNITPYQHLALHFPRHLRMFGPVHAWRCFAFERYNYVIQSLPTNHKFGQLEETMFSKFCSAQRIRAIFSQKGLLPKDLAPLAGFFHENYSKRYRMNINEVFFSDDDQRDEEISTWKTDDLAPIEPAVYDALRNDPALALPLALVLVFIHPFHL
ncbi:hypothetical protein D9611_001705 [Ephemerocybe angulata]|uniref:DUF4218 domain-containing protein n=1 Tax=Ephemerocybe angulata TaxID=980116 RepID=A0A8H5FMF2_9AGAR|nr:hypothetical protein D9611_001705 [Tulosesus angulatus]